MNKNIKIFICFFLSYILICGQMFAVAQDASLLPNGLQQFFDNDGNPLSSGTVTFYIPGTTTFKTTWQDAGKTIANTNPVSLDAAGRAKIYGSGSYRQILKKQNGDTVWDQITTSYQPTGTPTAQTGDGDLVGTIKPWAGMTAPNQYAFTYGQELSRVTYSALYAAVTQQVAANCTSGSAVLSGLSDTSNIPNGAKVESICAPVGVTVLSKTSSSITLSANATLTQSETIRVFPYGNGNGSTTFNVPDLRGNTLVGRCNMGGTNCTNVTSTYYGSNPQSTGASGGNQSYTILTGNLPAYTPSGTVGNTTATGSISGTVSITDPGHSHSVSNLQHANATDAASGLDVYITGNQTATTTSTTGVTAGFSGSFSGVAHNHSFTGSAQGGTSTPFSIVQPSLTMNYIIKITPDQNSAVATGVTSLGLMTGDIACGTNLVCTGNTISVIGAVAGGANTQVQFNSSSALSGNANLTWVSPALTIGSNGGSTGQLVLAGGTSGTLTQTIPAAVGSPTITWGTSSGTPAVTATSPISLNTSTGNLTCITCLTTGSGGSLAVSAPLSLSSSTVSITGISAISGGGTSLVSNAGATIGTATLTAPNFTQNWFTTGVITPTALSGAVNDYSPTGLSTANIIRQDGGAADRNITGLVAQTAGTKITFVNIGATNNLVFKNSSGSSSAANQFLIGADVTISPNQSVQLWYDGTSAKWRLESTYTNAGGTPTGTVTSITAGTGLSGGTITTSGTITNTGVVTVKVQKFTSNGTYTPSTGMIYAIIECVGGGGGGGGTLGTASAAFGAGGGAGGTYSRTLATAATVGASKTVTIGAAGAGGNSTPTNGGGGGTTSVGTICTAPGGGGGGAVSGANQPGSSAPGATGTGDYSVSGSPGGNGYFVSAASALPVSGIGGSAGNGAGGALAASANSSAANGNNAAANSGGGGSGGATQNTGAGAAGGNGGTGVVLITEYNTQ